MYTFFAWKVDGKGKAENCFEKPCQHGLLGGDVMRHMCSRRMYMEIKKSEYYVNWVLKG